MKSRAAPAILIVEDEGIIAKNIQQSLSSLGYDAYAIAASSDEAFARASERCPDLVLMDIRIKGKLDGIETASVLRERFDVPILYLTAHADTATIERAKKTEPLGYLVKPLKQAELRSAIEVSLYRNSMERRLRERERWFSTTLESIADAVVAVDLSGRVTFMNPVAEKLTGVKLADALGKPAQEIVRLSASGSSAEGLSPLDRALLERRPVQLLEARLDKGGKPAEFISDSAAPVLDDGELLGAVMVFRDVTQQKQLRQQLEMADRLASLGTMAAGVAHEVNNPLTVVVADADFIGQALERAIASFDSNPAEALAAVKEATDIVHELSSATTRIARIVGDLREFSRPEPQTFDAADVQRAVEWAVRSTTHELRDRARVRISTSNTPRVALDEMKLGQVLVNLLTNAAQAIAPGHRDGNEVALSTRKDDADSVVIEVRDTGSGIPEDVRTRIFEPFFTTNL